jgi:hypothetical protein
MAAGLGLGLMGAAGDGMGRFSVGAWRGLDLPSF